jgi:hypothetical protein
LAAFSTSSVTFGDSFPSRGSLGAIVAAATSALLSYRAANAILFSGNHTHSAISPARRHTMLEINLPDIVIQIVDIALIVILAAAITLAIVMLVRSARKGRKV